MNLQEMIKGESRNVEYKRELPQKSERYIKTVIAFANTSGGKIVIGIDDDAQDIIGVNIKEVFRIMDSIANAVSDSCEPQIIPDITFHTIEDKCVVIIEIFPGANRPYFLKSLGKESGTYIRMAGTSRPADSIKIKELEMEGVNLSWDELTCVGYKVTDDAVKRLCEDIRQHMIESLSSGEDRDSVHYVTKEHLLSWKVLKQTEGELLATNSFVLLTSDYFRFSRVQCALFKGMERDIFIDKKEYSGPLYEQIENAYQFVLRHINLGSEIDGIVRKDSYELPKEAIREMIVNAVCHRNYMDNSCVQVAVYDNRVEVTSPGALYGGLTIEQAMEGISKIRNRAVAQVLSRMEIVESWGTGIKRIVNRSREYGLPDPEFHEFGETFRVNIYRKDDKKTRADKKPVKKAEKSPIERVREDMIIAYIQKRGSISNKEARELLNLAESTTKRFLKQMLDENKIDIDGMGKGRKYILRLNGDL